jgi:photosystem II stability/assembly factor-like uncharacterized protein
MERRRHLAATLGLVVLVIIDAALVFAALRITGRSSAAEPATDVTAAATTSEPASTRTETVTTPTGPASSTAPATGPANVPGVPTTVVLSVVNGDVAWRATVGSCGPGGGAVDVTTDGGKTWRNRTSPFPVVTRISATDATKGFVVGGDAACSMGVRTTSDAGGTWPGTAPLADTLARDAKDPTKVHAPGNLTVAPCEAAPVVDLARSSSTAAQVMCADGTIRSSTDDGKTWPETAKITSGLALDSRLVGTTVTAYVAWTKNGCEGVQVSKVVDGQVSDLGCARTGAEAGPGQLALAAPTPDTGWLLVGGSTWRSSDGLKTWSKA